MPKPTTEAEAWQIHRKLALNGYVLLWSTVLDDFVAFYDPERGKESKIPEQYVRYSRNEIEELFGKGDITEAELMKIHTAKKEGAIVKEREYL